MCKGAGSIRRASPWHIKSLVAEYLCSSPSAPRMEWITSSCTRSCGGVCRISNAGRGASLWGAKPVLPLNRWAANASGHLTLFCAVRQLQMCVQDKAGMICCQGEELCSTMPFGQLRSMRTVLWWVTQGPGRRSPPAGTARPTSLRLWQRTAGQSRHAAPAAYAALMAHTGAGSVQPPLAGP